MQVDGRALPCTRITVAQGGVLHRRHTLTPVSSPSQWRYTAWLPWNGTTLRAEFPDAPVNGTGGFFEELYDYRNATLDDDFNTMDVHQVATEVRKRGLQCLCSFHTVSLLAGRTGSPSPARSPSLFPNSTQPLPRRSTLP